ncbi:hypothetical protein FIBSPDRAFT_901510 [Athelia psychrophila]|uniref:Uncharacterized protein n=1 Tax=Athelia psychrophila TaxID=1759441 RepID=A0A165X2K3_9AGAM|nr:hypothetical protein FIBSPDRAFT_901510 [Fibularhizoctonia sp. CBS 109695]
MTRALQAVRACEISAATKMLRRWSPVSTQARNDTQALTATLRLPYTIGVPAHALRGPRDMTSTSVASLKIIAKGQDEDDWHSQERWPTECRTGGLWPLAGHGTRAGLGMDYYDATESNKREQGVELTSICDMGLAVAGLGIWEKELQTWFYENCCSQPGAVEYG